MLTFFPLLSPETQKELKGSQSLHRTHQDTKFSAQRRFIASRALGSGFGVQGSGGGHLWIREQQQVFLQELFLRKKGVTCVEGELLSPDWVC